MKKLLSALSLLLPALLTINAVSCFPDNKPNFDDGPVEVPNFMEEKFTNNIYDFSLIKKTNLQNNGKEIEQIKKLSDQVLENKYILNSEWDMEPSPQEFYFPDGIDWNIEYNGDLEMSYMFSRMSFVNRLNKAYLYTEDNKYLIKAVEIVRDFMDKEPLTEESISTTWRTMDAAIRMDTLMVLSQILQDKGLKFEWLNKFIFEHINYLYTHYVDHKIKSNWSIFQNAYLLKTIIIIGKPELNSMIEVVKNRLEENIKLQFDDNGSHIERSTMYHAQVLDLLNQIVYLNQINLIEMSDDFLQKFSSATNVMLLSSDMNGFEYLHGDSDKYSIKKFKDSSQILLDKYIDSKIEFSDYSEESVFNFSKVIKNDFNKEMFEYKSVHLKDSRTFFARTKDMKLVFYNNKTNGEGHAHGDILDFNFDFKNKNFIVDPGRYTYKDVEEREILKSMSSHNTIVANDNPPQKFTSSWSVVESIELIDNYFKYDNDEEKTIMKGSYLDQLNNLTISREIIVDNDSVLINNSISESVNSKMYIVLDPNVDVVIEDGIITLNNDGIEVVIESDFGKEEITIEEQIYSSKYNVLENTKKIVFNIEEGTELNNNSFLIHEK